jgi:hypothetical protein
MKPFRFSPPRSALLSMRARSPGSMRTENTIVSVDAVGLLAAIPFLSLGWSGFSPIGVVGAAVFDGGVPAGAGAGDSTEVAAPRCRY